MGCDNPGYRADRRYPGHSWRPETTLGGRSNGQKAVPNRLDSNVAIHRQRLLPMRLVLVNTSIAVVSLTVVAVWKNGQRDRARLSLWSQQPERQMDVGFSLDVSQLE